MEQSTRKKPMTTEELFNEICRILKEKGRMPDILDYGLAAHSPVPVTNCEFDLKSNLDYGGNEGIYLDIWIEYSAEEKKCISGLGTFKTLNTNHEAMHTMAGLLADFIIEEYAYVNAHLDDFTWGARHPVDAGSARTGVERRGADVHLADESGKQLSSGYSCRTMEAALKRKDEILKKYPEAVVRDNVTRKEIHFKRVGNADEQDLQELANA